MIHNRSKNDRVNSFREWALRIVYYDFQSTFEELLLTFSVYHLSCQRLLIEIHKALHNIPTNIYGDPYVRNTHSLDLRSRPLFKETI